MYSQCSTYDGNDLHDAPTRSYCSVAPQVKQAAFSSCMDAGVGHASATCQLWRSRRRASQVQRFVRSLEFGQAAQLHILLRTSCACASTRHVPLRSQSTPKMPFYIYVHCSYTPLDKQRNIYMSSVPGTCHRSCRGIIRPFFALLFLGLKCHYHTQLAEII